jgi:hypothetical protein
MWSLGIILYTMLVGRWGEWNHTRKIIITNFWLSCWLIIYNIIPGLLHWVYVGDSVDVLEAYAASSFRVKICKVGRRSGGWCLA